MVLLFGVVSLGMVYLTLSQDELLDVNPAKFRGAFVVSKGQIAINFSPYILAISLDLDTIKRAINNLEMLISQSMNDARINFPRVMRLGFSQLSPLDDQWADVIVFRALLRIHKSKEAAPSVLRQILSLISIPTEEKEPEEKELGGYFELLMEASILDTIEKTESMLHRDLAPLRLKMTQLLPLISLLEGPWVKGQYEPTILARHRRASRFSPFNHLSPPRHRHPREAPSVNLGSEPLITIVSGNRLAITNLTGIFGEIEAFESTLILEGMRSTINHTLPVSRRVLAQLLRFNLDIFRLKFVAISGHLAYRIGRIIRAIEGAMRSELTPELLHPQELRSLINIAQLTLSSEYRLPEVGTPSDLALLYRKIKTSIVLIKGRPLISLNLPILDTRELWDLYEIFRVEIPVDDFSPLYKKLVIPDHQLVAFRRNWADAILLKDSDLSRCISFRKVRLCDKKPRFGENSQLILCFKELILPGTPLISECESKISYRPYEGRFYPFNGSSWLYVLPRKTRLSARCARRNSKEEVAITSESVRMSRWGVVRLNPRCELVGPALHLPRVSPLNWFPFNHNHSSAIQQLAGPRAQIFPYLWELITPGDFVGSDGTPGEVTQTIHECLHSGSLVKDPRIESSLRQLKALSSKEDLSFPPFDQWGSSTYWALASTTFGLSALILASLALRRVAICSNSLSVLLRALNPLQVPAPRSPDLGLNQPR